MYEYAGVHIIDIVRSVDKEYSYRIPEELSELIVPGCLVDVPFGNGNRTAAGIVTSYVDKPSYPNIKPIRSVHPGYLTLTEPQLALAHHIKDKYFCTISDAVKLQLPAGVVSADGRIGGSKEKTNKYVSLNLEVEEAETILPSLPQKQQDLLRCLLSADVSGGLLGDVCAMAGVTSSAATSLAKKGILNIEVQREFRIPYSPSKVEGADIALSEEQERAFVTLRDMASRPTASVALLFGVTGSGKTVVMKKLIDHVIAMGKQVILLLPEISLTPQAIGVFFRYYGDRTAILHSALSAGERFDTYSRIKAGEIDVVIGTRSAIFAPVKSLGLVIIDEEQEHTYKSDQTPRYHARDIARFRCIDGGAMMLLASATPSVETYFKAMRGVYTLVTLKNRYGKAILPDVIMADMREKEEGDLSAFSPVLRDEMAKNIVNHQQSIIFYNRRGYHNFLSCRSCGEAISCPNCSVALKLHTDQSINRSDPQKRTPRKLSCHYCGYTIPIPEKCPIPECGSTKLVPYGFGTQKLEDEIAMDFPSAKTVRMDADTTSAKFAYDKIVEEMNSRETDILIGTQMVAKGHDFPNVTLVGVLAADLSIYLDDYRANERSFALITQVIGRAGRADKAGRAVIQTYNPAHEVLLYARNQDYEGFYEQEIKLRKAALFPPFCDICKVTFASADEALCAKAAGDFGERLARVMEADKEIKLIVFGPFKSGIYKINNTFRMQYVIKCREDKALREMFDGILCEQIKVFKNVSIGIDINPNNI